MNKIENERYLDCKYLDAGMDGILCSMDLCTTCKEFNGENCSNYVSKDEIKQEAIEEMAKDIYDIIPDLNYGSYDIFGHYKRMAEEHYKQGYRNVKDKVVLTIEEHEKDIYTAYNRGYNKAHKETAEKYQARIDELEEEIDMLIKEQKEDRSYEIEQARKETAREILKSFGYCNDQTFYEQWLKLAKEYGVEVEE